MTNPENAAHLTTFAPTTGPVLGSSMSFLITRCDEHGTKECADFDSARLYVELAWACKMDLLGNDETGHMKWHYDEGHSCWVEGACCVVDPYGMFDH